MEPTQRRRPGGERKKGSHRTRQATIMEYRAILTNIAGGEGEPALRGFQMARRAVCLLLQLKPREDIPHAHLNDYDRMRRTLLDIASQPFEQLIDSRGAS